MDLVQTRSLLAVAEHGTIGEAAEAIGLSQPALSRRLRQLEEELGAPLLERSGRGVALTEAGRLAVAEGSRLVERYDELKRHIARTRALEAGTLRVGGGATALSCLLPAAIAAFRRRHPGVAFQLREAGSREIEAEVRDEALDLGIVTLPVASPEVEVMQRMPDAIVLVAGRGHPLAGRARIRPADLQGQEVVAFEPGSAIRRIVDAALREVGAEVHVTTELRSIAGILAMIETTRSLAFVSERAAPRARQLRVRGLSIRRELGVIRKRGRSLPPAADPFVAQLRRSART